MEQEKLVQRSKKYEYVKFLDAASNKKVKSSYPHQLFIECFSGCNYKCEFCPTSVHKNEAKSIDPDLFKKIVDECGDKVQFLQYYLQAEPTLNRNLPELVKMSQERYVDDCLFTNGSVLDEKFARGLIESGLEHIGFSITGATTEVYNEIHPGGSFEKVIKNMVGFLKLKDELGKTIRTRTVFIKDPRAMDTLERYEKLFNLMPIDYVSLSELINMFGHNEIDNMPKNKEEWLKTPTCTAPWRMMGINVNGDVRACFIDHKNRYLIGNINEKSVDEVWNGEEMQRFRQAVIDRDFEYTDRFGEMCSTCNAMVRPDALIKGNCWPYDFNKEVSLFFDNGEDYFGFRSDPEALAPKVEFMRKYADEWIQQVVDPQMSDDEFIAKYAS